MLKILNKKSLLLFFLILIIFSYIKISKNESISQNKNPISNNVKSKSNIINEVSYITTDNDGNKYTITSTQGEIDLLNNEIIYLIDVEATIELKNSEIMNITSDFGKYNIDNFDTIFSKNVKVYYLESNITGEYLDFSIERGFMIISRDVIYTNTKNTLKTDVIEIDLNTKDTKIFMYNNTNKVNIKGKKNWNGNNKKI